MAGSRQTVNIFDDDFEAVCTKWYNEANSDISDEETEEKTCIESDHSSDTEQELSEDEVEIFSETEFSEEEEEEEHDEHGNYYYGKNRFKWSKKEPTRNVRTPAHNIVLLPSISSHVEKSSNPVYYFNKMFSADMFALIVKRTNEKLATFRPKYKKHNRAELADTDEMELRAFLGLLLYTSIYKSNHEDLRSLFATNGKGRPIFRAVMSQRRFLALLAALRFDDASNRKERAKDNPASAIQELFDLFVRNSKNAYKVGANVCIDEMLVGFRGRCSFKMYMPSKPCKYGIKIQCMTDARTGFLTNAYIYAGKGSDGFGLTHEEKKMSKPTQSVIRLTKHLYGTNRNVTADNWFSSVELVTHLQKNKLTYVGTLKKNKREIPPEFLPRRTRKEDDTLYGFTKYITLLSRATKQNKAVILISSMHHSIEIDTDNALPEINSFYNLTKGGVDAMDEKCTKYSCSRRTRRWPMAIFYKIVDICSTNSYIMFGSLPENNLTRFQFIESLADELVSSHMHRRFNMPTLQRDLKQLIGSILDIPENESNETEEKLQTRKYCYICPSKLRRKTAYLCTKCQRPICLQCSKKICQNCNRVGRE